MIKDPGFVINRFNKRYKYGNIFHDKPVLIMGLLGGSNNDTFNVGHNRSYVQIVVSDKSQCNRRTFSVIDLPLRVIKNTALIN